MQLHSGITSWDDRSRILALALQTMEDETGPEGHALADELDPDTNGWWEPKVITNEAVATRERFMKDAKLDPGDMVIIEDGRPEES